MTRIPARPQSLEDIEQWAQDVAQSLRVLENRVLGPHPPNRWSFLSEDEVRDRIERDIGETELTAAFHAMAFVEQKLRARLIDLLQDPTVIAPASVESMTFEGLCDWWRKSGRASTPGALSEIKGWLEFRHWIAHGRWWSAAVPQVAAFHLIFSVCRRAVSALP